MSDTIIKQIPVGPMMNFAYLIGDAKAGICAAVDPGWEADKILNEAKNLNLKIEKILLTHAHFDHAQELGALQKATDAVIYVHRDETDIDSKSPHTHLTEDGTLIKLGGIPIKCVHTPGHTPGSQCFMADNALITGDTLFVDGCGRVDLPGSDPKKMLKSLKKLSLLSPDTIVYPGHDYGPAPTSTIGEQRKTNPYMSNEL